MAHTLNPQAATAIHRGHLRRSATTKTAAASASGTAWPYTIGHE
jgi:hypothetical protein